MSTTMTSIDAGDGTAHLRDDHLARVAELEPILREHAEDNERERRLVEPVVTALREAGMYRLGVPRHYGGDELDPLEICRVVAALAEIDSAVGWNIGLAAATSGSAALADATMTDSLYADGPDVVCAVSTAAPAFVTFEGDEAVVNGELRFMSGAHEADWFISLAILTEDGQPVMDGDAPALYLVCVPREAVEILDRWYVSGMRGTGSTDVSVQGARVPTWHVASLGELELNEHYTAPRYSLFPWSGIHFESTTSIGIARAAIRELIELAATKVAAMDTNPIRERERVQHNLGRAAALVEGAQAYMSDAMGAALEHVAAAGRPLPEEIKIALQLSAFQAADASARAVDLVCEAAGTSAARLEHRFERHHRDAHFLTKHASKSIERVTNVGRLLLGMPSGWPIFEL